jgi:hypothetical protein
MLRHLEEAKEEAIYHCENAYGCGGNAEDDEDI